MDFTLRPLTPEDLDHLVQLDSDPEVMRYITGGQPTPRALYVDLLLPRMLSAATRPGLGFFVIEDAGGEFMGWAHLRNDRYEPAWAEIGYRLARRWWGRGLATAASRQLMDRAFDALGFDTVSARTVQSNLPSRRVMEKLGLRFAGTFEFPAASLPGLSVPDEPAVLYIRQR